MMDSASIDRLRKVVALMDSPHEGERHAALNRAGEMLRQHGKSMMDLGSILGGQPSQTSRPPTPPRTTPADYREAMRRARAEAEARAKAESDQVKAREKRRAAEQRAAQERDEQEQAAKDEADRQAREQQAQDRKDAIADAFRRREARFAEQDLQSAGTAPRSDAWYEAQDEIRRKRVAAQAEHKAAADAAIRERIRIQDEAVRAGWKDGRSYVQAKLVAVIRARGQQTRRRKAA